MSRGVGSIVRRFHIPPLATGDEVRCPDCNKVMLRFGAVIGSAAMLMMCRCRDADNQRKLFTLIFHAELDEYMNAVKCESFDIDISDAIDINSQM